MKRREKYAMTVLLCLPYLILFCHLRRDREEEARSRGRRQGMKANSLGKAGEASRIAEMKMLARERYSGRLHALRTYCEEEGGGDDGPRGAK